MLSGTRDLQRRIKSINNIRQITRAMQLVATAKMKKSQKRAKDADFYATGAYDISFDQMWEFFLKHPME